MAGRMVRRVVTGHDSKGKAVFASDEAVEPVTLAAMLMAIGLAPLLVVSRQRVPVAMFTAGMALGLVVLIKPVSSLVAVGEAPGGGVVVEGGQPSGLPNVSPGERPKE